MREIGKAIVKIGRWNTRREDGSIHLHAFKIARKVLAVENNAKIR